MEGKIHLEDLNVDGNVIFEWMLQKQEVRCGLNWLRIGNSGG